MIYNRLTLLWAGILLSLLLPLCITGCHRNGNQDAEGTENTTHSSSELSQNLTEYEADDLSFETVLHPLHSGDCYVGECRSSDGESIKRFVLKLNEVEEKNFSATLYDITDSMKPIVSPEPVTGTIKRRMFSISGGGQEMVMKKVMLAQTGTGIKGSFTTLKKQYEFFLDRYEQPEYKEFEGRYDREIFPRTQILKNVKYGEAMGYWTTNVTDNESYLEIFAKGVSSTAKKKKLNLLMDIYFPDDDNFGSRPLIVFIHGGAFYIGDKADNPIVLWCKHFAVCGYVAASINYRMGFQLSKSSIERCGYGAVQDAHAAVRFLLSKKEEYRINPDYIFVAGSSAGAITALNLAFMRNNTRPEFSRKHGASPDMGNIETSGNALVQDFRIRAVANMWGAVSSLKLLSSSPTAIVSFHGDADKLVPYDSGVPFSDMRVKIGGLFFSTMYGSAAIHREAQKLGYRNDLHTLEGAGHAPHVDKDNQPTQKFFYIQQHITDFFYGEFVPPTTVLARESANSQWFRLDGGNELKDVRWKVEGGFILSSRGNRARVVFVEGMPHALRASALWKNGAAKVFSADL